MTELSAFAVGIVGPILWKVAVFVFVLGVLIFIHELGHFLFAKWCGVGVVRFSIGFGPAIWRRQFGETQYQIGIIPLGGYVRMIGDVPDSFSGDQPTDDILREETASGELALADKKREALPAEDDLPVGYEKMLADRSRWFIGKGLGARSAIVFAGPLFNWILAIILICASVILYGEVDTSARIGGIKPDSPAAAAGLQVGDVVLKLDGQPINEWKELATKIRYGSGKAVEATVQRGSETVAVTVQPLAEELKGPGGKSEKVYLVGITPGFKSVGFFHALKAGVVWTASATYETYAGVWGMLTGKISTKDLAGPVFIFDKASEQADQGLVSLFSFMAMLSISLAALNLLPIPVLDGGHLLFFLIEAIFGPISIRKKEFAQQIGVLLLLLLMGVAIKNDVTRPAPLTASETNAVVEKDQK